MKVGFESLKDMTIGQVIEITNSYSPEEALVTDASFDIMEVLK